MDKTDTEFEEKILKLKTKLVIYRNVLSNKNIEDHDLIGIILELIYSNTITIDEFLGISKKTMEYKNKNIRYLDEFEKELENIYETLTGDTKKKEAFRKNLLDWVKNMEINYIVLYLILIGIDKERHILSTKMKTTINILGILAFIYSLYILWKIITLIRK